LKPNLKQEKRQGNGEVYINNRCWHGLSGIKCFVVVEAELRCWPRLSRIKYFVVVEAELKTSIPNCSMLKGVHIAYYEIIV
jgi:hypothetical protein